MRYADTTAVVLISRLGFARQLFERASDFAAAPDIFPPDKFNAGVLLIKPSKATFDDMQAKIAILPSHDGGDTGAISERPHSLVRLLIGLSCGRSQVF